MITYIFSEVRDRGFAFVREWEPSLTTEQIASKLGEPLDIKQYLPNSGIEKIQTLRPKEASEKLMNQYSGSYGLDAFPFHSDLAHWRIPPRYFLLRCIVGSREVLTSLIPSLILEQEIGKQTLKLVLVVPRRKSNLQAICPMPIIFKNNQSIGIRWDFLFLQPLNDAAHKAYQTMNSIAWEEQQIKSICLEKAGDTLIVDNWKILHNRSSVPNMSRNRRIERIYFSKIGH